MGATTGITVAAAVALVNGVIEELGVGPELVNAVDPASVTVDWDACIHSGRRMKMLEIRCAIRAETGKFRHQFLPEVFLVADDGVVSGIFQTDCGTQVA